MKTHFPNTEIHLIFLYTLERNCTKKQILSHLSNAYSYRHQRKPSHKDFLCTPWRAHHAHLSSYTLYFGILSNGNCFSLIYNRSIPCTHLFLQQKVFENSHRMASHFKDFGTSKTIRPNCQFYQLDHRMAHNKRTRAFDCQQFLPYGLQISKLLEESSWLRFPSYFGLSLLKHPYLHLFVPCICMNSKL